MRFAIVAPPYRNSSAGVRVLHRLCHLLNELGHDAGVTTTRRNPDWNTKTITAEDPDTIVIYPETVAGNPLRARRVVRYFVLARPSALAPVPGVAGAELVIYLDDWMNAAAAVHAGAALSDDHRLFISVLEPDLFFAGTEPRFIDSVFVGRRGARAQRFSNYAPLWRFRITNCWPATRGGLAALLQRTRTLYCYDPGSALPFEAALCGADVRIVTDDGRLERIVPWETHALVRAWWNQNSDNVAAFAGLVRHHWSDAERET